jgi:SAM-dependent methyltransferase
VPAFQNAPAASERAAIDVPRGRLELRFCSDCSFVANDAFQPELVAYGREYESDQSRSPAFGEHVQSLVRGLVDGGVSGKRILEVGCGAGYFLRALCREGENSGVGYDPSYRGPEVDLAGDVRFVADYYPGGPGGPDADVVISRHVIEHVTDPRAFLARLRTACGAGGSRRLFIETPALEWILDHRVIEDFFYEHCSYFSAEALRFAVEAEGFEVLHVTPRFGGQYLWLEAVPAPERKDLPAADRVQPWADAARRYGSEVRRRVSDLAMRLEALRARGPVCVWGAGAKGVTLVNLTDPERRLVAALVDINPRKQGRFAPGTGHAIVGPDALRQLGARSVVVMNPNYAGEVSHVVREVDPEIQVHVCDAL